ncbi:hypothetical protein H0O00_03275 [Candidatus Micrarchaeota archaeon]|nr:hypothetical protein [Candidatus Micrarchaeota archaeon]
MEIILRDYRIEDRNQAREVVRDANNSLRKSCGGMHPDEAIDHLTRKVQMRDIPRNPRLQPGMVVAEVKETGEIIGTGAITRSLLDKLLGSAYSTTHYVKQDFQRGKAGVSVGSLLRKETIARAKALGCRKMYGLSTPEAVGFHSKFGARFFPNHDRSYLYPPVRLCYYEMELKPSMWNGLRIEPYTFIIREAEGWLLVLPILLGGVVGSLFSLKEMRSWFQLVAVLISELLGIKPGKKAPQGKTNGG